MPSEPDSLHTLLLFDSMSDAIVTFNRSMRIELFNRAAEARFQCARAEGRRRRFLTKGLRQALEASLAEFDRSVDARPCM